MFNLRVVEALVIYVIFLTYVTLIILYFLTDPTIGVRKKYFITTDEPTLIKQILSDWLFSIKNLLLSGPTVQGNET